MHGVWNWVDQSAYDYNHWWTGEPNHNDDMRYCAQLYAYGVGEDMLGYWDDTLCSFVGNGYICERKRSK